MQTDDLTPETVSRVHELNAAYLRCIERGMLAMSQGHGMTALVLAGGIPPDAVLVLVGSQVHGEMAALRAEALKLTSADRAASVLARAMGSLPPGGQHAA